MQPAAKKGAPKHKIIANYCPSSVAWSCLSWGLDLPVRAANQWFEQMRQCERQLGIRWSGRPHASAGGARRH